MTDKQIIIDGVDVSGCEWIREFGLDSEYICTCNSPNKTSGYCKDNPNCYYKQLQQEKQNSQEARDTAIKEFNKAEELNTLLKHKQQELNDYKKQFKADTKEMENYQNEITRHLESIEYWQHQTEAKEQECERLKERLRQCWTIENSFVEQIDQLEVQNGELKEKIKYMEEYIKTVENSRNEFEKESKFLKEENKKMKQTLVEIKEIAENAEEQCAIPENYFKRNNVSWKQHQLKGLTCKFQQILQKISEVLKDE